jgi:hypothetical protein
VHRTGSRGGAKARRAGAQRSQVRLDGAAPVAASGRLAPCGRSEQRSTYLRTAIILNLHRSHGSFGIVERSQNRAPHPVTEMNFGLHSAGRGRLAPCGRSEQRSTYLRTAIILNLHRSHGSFGIVERSQNRAPHPVTEMNFGLHSAGRGRLAPCGRSEQRSTYLRTAIILNLHRSHGSFGIVERSQNRAPHPVTEMNFGLHSAGRGRLARHGRPGQGSTYLRTAII